MRARVCVGVCLVESREVGRIDRERESCFAGGGCGWSSLIYSSEGQRSTWPTTGIGQPMGNRLTKSRRHKRTTSSSSAKQVTHLVTHLVWHHQHWRQPRRGCRGHIPQYFGWGTSTGISPHYYYLLSDIADQYWLPSVRSASSRFHSPIRRHQFASVRQADSRHSVVRPPNLELEFTPLLTSQKTHRPGLGLGGSVHEDAHPCFPCFIHRVT